MVDELKQVLDSIEDQLGSLYESYTFKEINEETYAFQLHDLLNKLPTPPAPFHNLVMARMKNWTDTSVIPNELVGPLREKIRNASKESAVPGADPPAALLDIGSAASGSAAAGSVSSPLAVDGDRTESPGGRLGKRSASPKPGEPTGGKRPMLLQPTLSFQAGLVLKHPSTGRSSPLVPPSGRSTPASISGRSTPMEESDVSKAVPSPTPERIRVKVHLRVPSGGSSVACSFSFEEAKIDMLKSKRRKIHQHEKQAIIAEAAKAASQEEALRLARKTPGFEKLSAGQLTRWQVAKPHKKSGRPVNTTFEAEVLDELIFTQVANETTTDEVEVVANVAYSYAIIKHAAQSVQARTKWADDEKLQKYLFTNPWIVGFLERNVLRRRRITSTEKKLPPPAEIHAVLSDIQSAIRTGGYAADEVVNGDETGVNFGAGPKNQYVPQGEARGTMPASDEKARFTDFLWGDSDGDMGEVFSIIKCTAKGPDLRNTRVLQNLMEQPGFGVADGWQLKRWQRELTLKVKGSMVTRIYYRPYLIHEATGHVMTIQHRAWMDSVGVSMLFDLVIGPHYKKKRGKALLVWDNCGPHKVAAVKEVATEWGIELKTLPPNMTDALQVMDLLVNAPLKARIRSARVRQIFDYFQSWKVARLQAQVGGTALPPFQPPKPTLAQGLMTMRSVHQELFTKESFKDSMKKCFIDCCYARAHDGSFKTYMSHTRGKMNKHLFPPMMVEKELGNLAEVAADVVVEVRTEADAEGDGEEEEDDGEEQE